MNARDPRLWLAAASALLVAFLVFADMGSTSPGPLSAAHARVDGLSERDCAACHGDGERDMAASCNACHEAIGDQLVRGDGFHGALGDASRCGTCHAEHLGDDLPLVGARAFERAGYAPRETYDHAGLGFGLEGVHADLACVECHANADAAVLATGEVRFLGASQDCASCHEDPHDGRMVRACADCHGQTAPFTDVAAFRHTDDFPLTGAHAGVACADCHAPGSAYEVEALGGRDAPPARDCATCHESPHSEPFVRAVASLVERAAGATCASCHPVAPVVDDASSHAARVAAAPFTAPDLARTRELHPAGGFPLVAPHDAVDCGDCHDPNAILGARAPRSPDACGACHDDPHGDQFADGPFAGVGCLTCHERAHFAPAAFDVALHERTAFALEASHARASCDSCHEPAVGAALGDVVFGDADARCASCHADAHGGAFGAEVLGARAASGCVDCHRPTRFDDVPREAFDHARWTAFALDGAHAAADCEACHARAAVADEAGRTFGRVADRYEDFAAHAARHGGAANACASCHADAHGGALSGGDDCAACHASTRFDDVVREDFDHASRTAFALVGAHAAADCEACHAPFALADEYGRTFGRAHAVFGASPDAFASGAADCATCHADPHEGRFRAPRVANGATSCARCHDQTDFAAGARERFDHALWTGWALDGAHASVACADCHDDAAATGDRYAALSTSCSACHADAHVGQFRDASGATDCARCHQSAASFADLAFDHQRDARFALDENHRGLDCGACHQPWPLAGGGEAVRYKPLGVECADCHLGGNPR